MPDRPAPSRLPSPHTAVALGLLLGAAALLPLPAVLGRDAGRDAREAIHTPATGRDGVSAAAVGPLVGLPGNAGGSIARVPDPLDQPAAAAFDPTKVDLHLTLLKSGLSKPVLVTHAGDGSGRLFVVEQTGKIRVITSDGTLLATPYLDVSSLISTGSEQGLLGLAFHPHFETNGYVFVNYTSTTGDTFINRYTASTPSANTISRGTGVRIMTIAQPYANHNGGNLAFGPDGYLYIGMGDGGSSGDPGNRAQSLNSLLGKILRIDIDHTSTGKRYRAPATNPYVGRSGLDEIWSRGLRNPWRWSFDPKTRALWIGDVGQSRYEEIDRANASSTMPGGRAVNFGWRQLEGRACYNPSSGCSTSGKHPPLVVYGHAVSGTDNCSVTGGFVYRGTANPVLTGGYVYGDFCSGRIWVVSAGAYTPATGRLVRGPEESPTVRISSFGQDQAGELYLCDLGGRIYKISATSL